MWFKMLSEKYVLTLTEQPTWMNNSLDKKEKETLDVNSERYKYLSCND